MLQILSIFSVIASIQVVGICEKEVEANLYNMNIVISKEANKEDLSLDKAMEINENLIPELKRLGLVETENISTYEKYTNSKRDGFKTDIYLRMVINNKDNFVLAMELLKDARITNINHEVSKGILLEKERECLSEAVKDGMDKAKVLANASNQKLGAVIKIKYGETEKFTPYIKAMTSDNAINPKKITIKKEVHMEIKLK